MSTSTPLDANGAGSEARIVPQPARPRVAFVGVDPDARGGIAQFGANLVRSVEDRADTLIVSYRRLYPRFTRPGRQDRTQRPAVRPRRHPDDRPVEAVDVEAGG